MVGESLKLYSFWKETISSRCVDFYLENLYFCFLVVLTFFIVFSLKVNECLHSYIKKKTNPLQTLLQIDPLIWFTITLYFIHFYFNHDIQSKSGWEPRMLHDLIDQYLSAIIKQFSITFPGPIRQIYDDITGKTRLSFTN